MKDGLLTDAITGKLNDELENIATMLESLPPDSRGWKEALKTHFDEIIEAAAKASPTTPAWDFSEAKALGSLAFDDTLLIRPFRETDIDFYTSIRRQWSIISQRMLELPEVGKAFFLKECQEDYAFYCIVERIQGNAPIGYIALKDTRQPLWEIAIELDEGACGHGYGPRAISLFLHAIRDLTGHSEYQARVEPDNVFSQKCMMKAGAQLHGVCDSIILNTEKEKTRFEEQNLEKIDDNLRELAAKLGLEPRKLLSQVLDYRIEF